MSVHADPLTQRVLSRSRAQLSQLRVDSERTEASALVGACFRAGVEAGVRELAPVLASVHGSLDRAFDFARELARNVDGMGGYEPVMEDTLAEVRSCLDGAMFHLDDANATLRELAAKAETAA